MTLRTRLILGFLLILGVGFYFSIRWITDDIRLHYLKSMEETLVDLSTLLSAIVAQDLEDGQIKPGKLQSAFNEVQQRRLTARIYGLTKKSVDLRIYIVNTAGVVIFDSDQGREVGKDYSRWRDIILTLKGEYGARSTQTDWKGILTSIMYVAAPIILKDEIVGVLTVCKPKLSVSLFIEQARKRVVILGLILFLSIILLGVVLTLWVTGPVNKMTAYAKAVRDGQKVSLPRLRSKEIQEMGVAFEEMKDALSGKKYVEEYVQTLTHELKSPLAAIKGTAELLTEEMPQDKQQEFIHNIGIEAGRIQQIIDRILQLSALESRKNLKDLQAVDLGQVIRQVIETLTPLIEAKGLQLQVQPGSPLPIQAEAFLVRQAVTNLLQNAIDFTPAGGQIQITLTDNPDTISLVISDSGVGIPDYALTKVFDRFYSLSRPETGRKSTGLGLSFVKEVAELHQGTVKIENQQSGGVRAELTLSKTL